MLSQTKKRKKKFRFPYIRQKPLHFSVTFETKFQELWHSLRKPIANNDFDLQIFHEENHIFLWEAFNTQLVMKTLLKN